MEIPALILYAAAVFLAASRAKRQGGGAAAFFVNNRSSSARNVGMSILVSCVGASATVGIAGMAFKVGTPAFWWLGSGACGLLLLCLFLAKKVRRSKAFTMPQLVENLLGRDARLLVSVIIVLAWIAVLAAQFSASVRILDALTGLDPKLCLLFTFVFISCHTVYGGQAAVMRTDGMHGMIMLCGLATAAVWLGLHNPAPLSAVSFEMVNSDFPVARLLHFLCVIGGSYVVCPMLFGRMLCASDAHAAQRGGFLGVAGLLVFAALIVALGLACRGLIPAETPADAVLARVLTTVLPQWLQPLVLIALLGAIVSSADSCLITAGTVLCRDLLHKSDSGSCRLCILVLACAGATLSLQDKSVLTFLLMANDVYVSGAVAPVAAGLLLQGRRNIGPRFACAAVFSGGCMGAAAALTGQPAWSYAGMLVSAALSLLGTDTSVSGGVLRLSAITLYARRRTREAQTRIYDFFVRYSR